MSKFAQYLQMAAPALSQLSSPEHQQAGAIEQMPGAPDQQMSAPEQMPGALDQSMGTGPGASLGDTAASLAPPLATGPGSVPPSPEDRQVEQGPSFMEFAASLPDKQIDEEISKLEKQGVDLDEGYREIMEILGERPNTRTSRREKGLLIMEFGLHLMANSAASRHGGDLGGAIGDSGINAIESYRRMKQEKKGEQRAWDDKAEGLGMDQLRRQQALEDEQRADERGALVDVRRDAARRDSAYERLTRRMPDGALHTFAVNPYTGDEVDLGEVAEETVRGRGGSGSGPSVYEQRRTNMIAALTTMAERTGPLTDEALDFIEAEATMIVQGQRNEAQVRQRALQAAARELEQDLTLSRQLQRQGPQAREEHLRRRAEEMTNWIMTSSVPEQARQVDEESRIGRMMQAEGGGFSTEQRQELYETMLRAGRQTMQFRDRDSGRLYEVREDGSIRVVPEGAL